MNTESTPGYTETECEERLREHPETQPPCGAGHCTEFMETEYFHQACSERPLFFPVQAVGCYNAATKQWIFAPPGQIFAECKQKQREDPNWELEFCFCCCGAAAGYAAVAVAADAERPITEIDKGDTVLSGRVLDGKVGWGPAKVAFSQGTVGAGEPDTVRIALAGERRRPLSVSPDQPLMLADGTLATAAELTAGAELMGADGGSVTVLGTERGRPGDLHHIATGEDWDGSPDGHLIQANGVVLGDFTLLLHYPELVPAAAEA